MKNLDKKLNKKNEDYNNKKLVKFGKVLKQENKSINIGNTFLIQNN